MMNQVLTAGNGVEAQIQTDFFRKEVKKRSDNLMNYFLPAFFLIGIAFATFYDTWLIAMGVGSLSLIAYHSAKMLLPSSNLYQYVLSVVLGVFMAQYIYQMHGLFEMHFFAFIGSAILITYQNWKLQIPLMLLVVVHHMLFGYLQDIGFDSIYFTQLDSFTLQTFIIHTLLAAIIFFICGLWAYQLKKYNEKYITQTVEMSRLQKEKLIARNAQKQQEERMKAQQELEKSNQRFLYAAQATSDAIWDRNYSDNTIFWGEGYKSLFGYELNEETMSVAFWKSKIHPEDIEKTLSIIAEAKSNPSINTWNTEYRFLKASGEYAFVREKAIILRNEKGTPARTIGALQDITESKQNEIAMVDKAVAQGKFEIASDVMHDIGNAVVGFGAYLTRIKRLQEQAKAENLNQLSRFFETQKPVIAPVLGDTKTDAIITLLHGIANSEKNNQEEISKSITEQINIITHIQDILNIQRQYISGHESGERKSISLRNIINDAVSMLFATIDKSAIAVSFDIDNDLPIMKGDRTKLMQVLINLLKNSIDAIEANAAEKTILIKAFQVDKHIILQVKDSGKGFEKDTSAKLFTRGFTTKASGSGLSLYNCRSIIESHKGTIDMTSEGNGKGSLTTISILL